MGNFAENLNLGKLSDHPSIDEKGIAALWWTWRIIVSEQSEQVVAFLLSLYMPD